MGARPANWLPADFAELNPNAWTEPFWLAAREHRLVVPRCTKCETFRFPPSPFCHECNHQDVDLVQVSGVGTVYTYTVAGTPSCRCSPTTSRTWSQSSSSPMQAGCG